MPASTEPNRIKAELQGLLNSCSLGPQRRWGPPLIAHGDDSCKRAIAPKRSRGGPGAESVEGWPATRLTVPNRRRNYALPPAAYPASFLADVDAYLANLAGDDLFATTGRGPASPTTLGAMRLRLFQMAAALVHSGQAPQTIRSLVDLAEPEALKTALTFFLVAQRQTQDRPTPQLRTGRDQDRQTLGQAATR